MPRVAIIDHGHGNLHAVEKALVKAGGGGTLFRCHSPDDLRRADCAVLSGTGSLRGCADELDRLGMAAALSDFVRDRPLLAINAGLHALVRQGLDLIPADVQPLNADGVADVRLPHMGWNRVHRHGGHALWEGIPQDSYFYFAHRDRVHADDALVAATTEHAGKFPAVLARELFVGVQFQPEISHRNGLRFLANFVNWDGAGSVAGQIH